MRSFFVLCIFLALAMVLCPLVSLSGNTQKSDLPNSGEVSDKTDSKTSENDDGTIKVFLSESSEVISLSTKEYLCGAVAAEMNATYHEEALKAQAVACHTYAVRTKNQQLASPTASLNGAYISNESSTHQGYLTVEQQKEKWGDKYDTYSKKIEKAVNDVSTYIMTYEGQPVLAAFHSICSGQTENAKVIWGEDYPYLQSVISSGDKLSPDYSSTLVLTAEQFKEMAVKLDGVSFSEDASLWVGSISRSEAGTVTSVEIGGKTFSGAEVRKAFSLRSPCFELTYKNNSFIFNVTGYGHGVGMSQYGADYMARQGSSWKDILSHYYTGVTIENF